MPEKRTRQWELHKRTGLEFCMIIIAFAIVISIAGAG
jgi:hypothetical protein